MSITEENGKCTFTQTLPGRANYEGKSRAVLVDEEPVGVLLSTGQTKLTDPFSKNKRRIDQGLLKIDPS